MFGQFMHIYEFYYSFQLLINSFIVGESFANKGVIWKYFETNLDLFENMFM